MKVLIAVKGCHRDAQSGVHQAARDTWLKDLPFVIVSSVVKWDYKFFVGRYGTNVFPPQDLKDDEVGLECPDDYPNLPLKTKAILEWALSRGYDYVYLCDTDTLVMPDRLLGSGFQKYDYMGGFNGNAVPGDSSGAGSCYAWASGGPGYWLSARAAEEVTKHGVTDWAEDRWVGQVLGPEIRDGRLTGFHNVRYYWGRNGAHEVIDICLHYSSEGSHRPFDREWMYAWWRELKQL